MKTGGIRAWLSLGLLGLAILLLSSGCASRGQLQGHSMEPTIRDGERVTLDTDAFKDQSPQRGDIVFFEYEKVKRVSRVIGLPGEKIDLQDGVVFVDGNKLSEPYLAQGTRTESATKQFQVPEGSYFVLGDNRERSSDSRIIGFISRAWITAKVIR